MMWKQKELTYLGDRVSTGGWCEAAVTAGRCGWVKLGECRDLLYGKTFFL